MIRIICAWALLVLAVSPFTAPFSTCDAATLLGHAPSAWQWTAGHAPAVRAITIANDDAFSLSPEVARFDVAGRPALGGAPVSAPTADGAERRARAPRDVSWSPQQPAVLRL